jgi:hypothetical protein
MKLISSDYITALAVAGSAQEFERHMREHRKTMLNLRERMYHVIPASTLESLSEACLRYGINLTPAKLENLLALFPQHRVCLLDNYCSESVAVAFNAVSQYYLGCAWPDYEYLSGMFMSFLDTLRKEVDREAEHGLDKPHSYTNNNPR